MTDVVPLEKLSPNPADPSRSTVWVAADTMSSEDL
jgi:hypothetical protein